MGVTTYQGTVEGGQIKVDGDVRLPEKATVYIVVPDPTEKARARIRSPRLARPEDAARLVKEVTEVVPHAGL